MISQWTRLGESQSFPDEGETFRVAFVAPVQKQALNTKEKTAQLECALQLPQGPLCRLFARFPLISSVVRWKAPQEFESHSVVVHTAVVSVEAQFFECRVSLTDANERPRLPGRQTDQPTGALCVKKSSQHVHIVYPTMDKKLSAAHKATKQYDINIAVSRLSAQQAANAQCKQIDQTRRGCSIRLVRVEDGMASGPPKWSAMVAQQTIDIQATVHAQPAAASSSSAFSSAPVPAHAHALAAAAPAPAPAASAPLAAAAAPADDDDEASQWEHQEEIDVIRRTNALMSQRPFPHGAVPHFIQQLIRDCLFAPRLYCITILACCRVARMSQPARVATAQARAITINRCVSQAALYDSHKLLNMALCAFAHAQHEWSLWSRPHAREHDYCEANEMVFDHVLAALQAAHKLPLQTALRPITPGQPSPLPWQLNATPEQVRAAAVAFFELGLDEDGVETAATPVTAAAAASSSSAGSSSAHSPTRLAKRSRGERD